MENDPLEKLRDQFQAVYDAILACRNQFSAWFEEAKKFETKSEEIHRLIGEILTHEKDYEVWIDDLPKVKNFTPEELETCTGEVGRLYAIGDQLIRLGNDVEIKLAMLRYLIAGNQIH